MKALRLAHLTDLHLTDGPRLSDQAAVLQHIVQQAVTLGVQATLLTGDLYGRTVPHRSTPSERAVLYPAVRTLSRLGPVVVTPGNHDYPGDLDTLAALGGGFDWPVVVQSRPGVIKLATPGAPLHVYAVPWPTARNLLQDDVRTKMPADQTRQIAGAKLDQLLGLWGGRVNRARSTQPGVVHALASHCMTVGARTSGGEELTGKEIELSRHAMDALGCDYGALGHIHFRQQSAPRCWYGGDPWAVDFGETDRKGWHLVDIAPPGATLPPAPEGALDVVTHQPDHRGQALVRISWMPTPCRQWVTLDWRWSIGPDGTPQWMTQPTPEEIASVKGAEVRARLVAPQQWVAGCPWEGVISSLKAAGAHRITAERKVEPVHRVRAPEVAAATTPLAKMQAYWGTLETDPPEADKAAAIALLHDLQTTDDNTIKGDTDALL